MDVIADTSGLASKVGISSDDHDSFSVMPQGGNGLQPRVAASATLGDERNLSSTAMRLCLLGAFSPRKRRNRVAVEYSY